MVGTFSGTKKYVGNEVPPTGRSILRELKVNSILNLFPDTDEEWEAELEGELNEFEVVSSKDGSPQNQEWENEIETMLDAEDGGK